MVGEWESRKGSDRIKATASDTDAAPLPSPVAVLDVAVLRLRYHRPPGCVFAIRLKTLTSLSTGFRSQRERGGRKGKIMVGEWRVEKEASG